MNEPLVSLIVPIYGVESYIEQCARSVLGQTYPRMEFIFVNDGTKDRSMDVLSRVLEDFPGKCVKIVNKENAGLPLARKSGLEVATGEYVMHVDADDWIESDAVARLVEKALETGADLVYCDFWKEYANRSKLDHERLYTVETKARWMKRLYDDGAYGYVWCKFAKRSLYEGIFAPRFNMHEDIIFSTQLIFRATKIAQLSVPLIHYRRTNYSSATRVGSIKIFTVNSSGAYIFCSKLKASTERFTSTFVLPTGIHGSFVTGISLEMVPSTKLSPIEMEISFLSSGSVALPSLVTTPKIVNVIFAINFYLFINCNLMLQI